MRIRDEDFDKYVEQVKDPAKKAELEAQKEKVLALEKGKLLRPDEIEDEAIKSLVKEHRARFKEFLSLSNFINQFSKAVEEIEPTLEDPKVLDPLKAVLEKFDHTDQSLQNLQNELVKSDLLPFFYRILENSKVDKSVPKWKFYESIGMLVGMSAKKDHPEAVDKLIEALDGPAQAGAAMGLGEIGDPRSVEPLIQYVRRKKDHVRSEIITALGAFQDQRVTDLLIECLERFKDEKLPLYVVMALEKNPDTKVADALLKKATAAETPGILKTACFRGLSKMAESRFFHPLIKELEKISPSDNDYDSGYHILRTIEELLPRDEHLSSEEFTTLVKHGRYRSIDEKLQEYVSGLSNTDEKRSLIKATLESGDRTAEEWVMDLLQEKPGLVKECYEVCLPFLKKMLAERKSEAAFKIMAAQGEVELLIRLCPKYHGEYTFGEPLDELIGAHQVRALPVLEEMLYEMNSQTFAWMRLRKIRSVEVEDIFMRVLRKSWKQTAPDDVLQTGVSYALDYLTEVKSAKVVPYLFRKITDINTPGTESGPAHQCLRRIGGEVVIENLIDFFRKNHDDMKTYWDHAIDLATEVPDARLVNPLIDCYLSDIHYENRHKIVSALGILAGRGLKDKVIKEMQKLMKGVKREGVELAASVYQEIRDPETVGQLMDTLGRICEMREFESSRAKQKVVEALTSMGPEVLDSIQKKLETSKNGANVEMRLRLLDVIANSFSMDRQKADEITVSMIDDSNPEVERKAIVLAATWKMQGAVEKILKIVGETKEDFSNNGINRRAQAVQSLGMIGGDRATEALISLCTDDQWDSLPKERKLNALAATQNAKAIPVLFDAGKIRDAMKIIGFTKTEPADEKIKRVAKIHGHMEKFSDEIAGYLPFNREENIIFCERIVGSYSKRAAGIFEGVLDCLKGGVLTNGNKNELWDYLEHVNVVTPILVRAYMEASNKKEFFADVEALTNGILNPGADKPELKTHPLYDEIIKTIYQNNSTSWTNYEKNKECQDRTEDLKDYTIRERYVLDLGANTDLVVKEGQTLDIQKLDPIKARFYRWSTTWKEMGYDKEKMLEDIGKRIDEAFGTIKDEPWAQGADSMEKKLFAVVAGSIITGKMVDEVKNLLIGYQFAKYEDIRAYIQGTTDRVANARNKEYAYLGELHTFFADQIKEISRKMLGEAEKDEWLQKTLPAIFKKLRAKEMTDEKQETLNRMNPKKEADMESFRKQISGVLKGKKWGIAKKMVLAKRQKIAKIAQAAGNPKYADPKRIQLGTITLEELLNAEENISLGRYNPETFSKYMAQKLMDTFEEELGQIEGELSKFESKESKGKQVKKLNAYITKNSASANARMVGGVCVSGDMDQWNDPQYLQMVFHDPEDNTCKGLVLMHVWEQDGKKYLVASLNPSSTYLYGVDEKSLFDQICAQLTDFASANGIRGVGFSTNKQIRTNRTGGEFENAMNKRIAEAKEKHGQKADLLFKDIRQFSKHPQYKVDNVDFIWIEGDEVA